MPTRASFISTQTSYRCTYSDLHRKANRLQMESYPVKKQKTLIHTNMPLLRQMPCLLYQSRFVRKLFALSFGTIYYFVIIYYIIIFQGHKVTREICVLQSSKHVCQTRQKMLICDFSMLYSILQQYAAYILLSELKHSG